MLRKSLLFALAFLALSAPAAAQCPGALWCNILPSATHAIDWSQVGAVPGTPGAIPSVLWTQSGSTITAAQSPCNNGAGDCTSTIQTALNACGTNHYVLLGSGTFSVTGITIPNNCELRGGGANSTVITCNNTTHTCIDLGLSFGSVPTYSNNTSITGGNTKGSTSITVSSASGISAGTLLLISELNDWTTKYASIWGDEGNCNFCGVWNGSGWSFWRTHGQIDEVTNVSGTTLTLKDGLYDTYSDTEPDWASGQTLWAGYVINPSTQSTHVYAQVTVNGSAPYTCTTGGTEPTWPTNGSTVSDGGCSWQDLGAYVNAPTWPLAVYFTPATDAGVSNLQVLANGTCPFADACSQIEITECAFCWISGVETNYADAYVSHAAWSYHVSIVNSYFSNAFTHTSGYDSDGVFDNFTSASLMQNNIFERLHGAVLVDGSSSGNVVGYNFTTGANDQTAPNFASEEWYSHTAHPAMNLWEGNVGTAATNDSIHGSNGEATFFRDWLKGTNLECAPIWAGVYSSGTTYIYQTAVLYNGVSYQSLIASNTGNTPSSSPSDWAVLTGRGPASCSTVGTYGNAGVNAWWTHQASRMLQLDAISSYPNVVGTILGSQDIANHTSNTQTAAAYAICGSGISTSCGTNSRLYDGVSYNLSLGYSNSGDTGQPGSGTIAGYDSLVPYTTGFYHGVYTSANSSIIWSGSVTHSLPSSFYLTANTGCGGTGLSWWKVSGQSCIPFPAIGPDVTTGIADSFGYANEIPAMNCYLNVMGGAEGGPNSPLTFNASSCYQNDPSGTPPVAPPSGQSLIAMEHR